MDIESILGVAVIGAGLYLFTKSSPAQAAYYDTASMVTGQTPYYSDSADIWGTAPETGPSYSGNWWDFPTLSFDWNQTTVDTNPQQADGQTTDLYNPFDWETLTNTDQQTSDVIPIGDINMATYWKTNDYPKYATFIANIEDKYGLQRDLLARILYQESRYNPDIISGLNRSPVGALGIAQFMPDTAAWLHVNPLEPFSAIDKAGYYLKYLINRFSGNVRYAVMAYNWGEGNVKHWINGDINPRTGQAYTPPQETQNYIAQISTDVSIA